MLEISPKTNLLEQKTYKYTLQDVEEPNLYRDVYPYTEVPRIAFNHRRVPIGMPEDIWITDTSFRDGQQSVEPYTVQQIVDLYRLMSRLGGPFGIIRQTEFFVYSKKDREAVERCMELGLKFPEITTWIRASREDFKLVRDLGIRETGLLDALRAEPLQAADSPGTSCRIVMDADPGQPGAIPKQDLPLSFSPIHRQFGYRPVQELPVTLPTAVPAEEETTHDPFAELR